jgi:NADH:ubiquinone oxidoreductase subunit E
VSRTPTEITRSLVEKYGSSRESIMQILTDLNSELGYIPVEVIGMIADAAGVSDAEVYGVISFYSFLSTTPRGRHIVRLCSTVSCKMSGAGDVLEAVMDELGIRVGETTPDGRITLETTSCIGLCDQSPAMLVNDRPFSRLTPESARGIVAGLE